MRAEVSHLCHLIVTRGRHGRHVSTVRVLPLRPEVVRAPARAATLIVEAVGAATLSVIVSALGPVGIALALCTVTATRRFHPLACMHRDAGQSMDPVAIRILAQLGGALVGGMVIAVIGIEARALEASWIHELIGAFMLVSLVIALDGRLVRVSLVAIALFAAGTFAGATPVANPVLALGAAAGGVFGGDHPALLGPTVAIQLAGGGFAVWLLRRR